MFYSDKLDEKVYSDLMEQIKNVNRDWLTLRTSRQYKLGLVMNEVTTDIRHLEFSALKKAIQRWVRGAKSKKIKSENRKMLNNVITPNYFSNEKIAVYTAVFGPYDRVPEPYCKPDNCDFYIFTDQDNFTKDSIWQKMDNPEIIKDYSNSEKNRYLKMHPDQIFNEYKYSIYVDGNVQIITDLTEYVNLLGESGIGIHLHDTRSCVYEEMEAIRKTGREQAEIINKHLEYMKRTGMPANYGLLQCNVIVREHSNPVCKKIMNEWWQEYFNYTRRDQISLPHVLYRNGIEVRQVGVLGPSVYTNPSFRVLRHE